MPLNVQITLSIVYIIMFIIAIVISRQLNEEFQERCPLNRPFAWGYFNGIVGTLQAMLTGSIFFVDGMTGPMNDAGSLYSKAMLMLLIGVGYYYVLKRNRIAWIITTILTLNPVIWVINGIYIKHRWEEMDPDRKEC